MSSAVEMNSINEINGTCEQQRKRPYRWGSKIAATEPSITSSAPVVAIEEVRKPRKSRFQVAETNSNTNALAIGQNANLLQIPSKTVTHEVIQQTFLLQMKLKLINDRISTVAQDAIARDKRPDRSPSPPPKYDAFGKRVNTTEVWMRENLMQERNDLIEEMVKLNPLYVPPTDYIKPKPFRMLRIPQREFPNYNFIGLIIGPRGNTQKRMELETGTKISIRGKGSVKEGSKGRAAKYVDESDDLHVHITGDDESKVNMAAKMVAELLCPVDDDKNEHKQKQLRELALINGTLKEDEFCAECGERGHRQFECPQRIKSFKNAGVKCSICGDLSHPTRDCPLKEKGTTSEVVLDSEYDNFMSELGGKVKKESTVVTATVVDLLPKKPQTVVVSTLMTGLTRPTFANAPISPSIPTTTTTTTVYPPPLPLPVSNAWVPPPLPPPPPPPALVGGTPVIGGIGALPQPHGYVYAPSPYVAGGYGMPPQQSLPVPVPVPLLPTAYSYPTFVASNFTEAPMMPPPVMPPPMMPYLPPPPLPLVADSVTNGGSATVVAGEQYASINEMD